VRRTSSPMFPRVAGGEGFRGSGRFFHICHVRCHKSVFRAAECIPVQRLLFNTALHSCLRIELNKYLYSLIDNTSANTTV
jgi:hypothetical protein